MDRQVIRPATVADVPRLVEMACRFRRETAYARRARERPEQLAALASGLIEGDRGIMLVAVDVDGAIVGMIGLLVFPHPVSGIDTAGELVWWIEPEQRASGLGRQLLDYAEAWARQMGAQDVQMIEPVGTGLGQFYTRHGYDALEIAWVKRL